MDYTALETAIKDYCANSEASFVSHINDFIIAAEDKVFQAVKGSPFHTVSTGTITTGVREYYLAAGTLDVLSVRLCENPGGTINQDGPDVVLQRKDTDFLREAFPATTGTNTVAKGIPRYYAIAASPLLASESNMRIQFGPVPDATYSYEVQYYGKVATDSITNGATPGTTSTNETWLSVTFPTVLLYGACVEAYIYMKGEQDVLAMYQKNFDEGLLLVKNLVETRQTTDTFAGTNHESEGQN
jgi:hypothetical protein